MTFTLRPAVREKTPLIIGLAGPTKSGKTYSAHRIARGIVGDSGIVAMINAEGARGHQYADKFKYSAIDIAAPFSPSRYTEAVKVVQEARPECLIIDSASHCHDGPGGLLEMHDDELDRMAGQDYKKRERMTWTAWIRPKKDENEFIYTLLSCDFPIILCFRAKEKLKIIRGKEPIDMGWQPIASDRIAFETIFTLMLPPHCKGVPDLSLSEMREPFDSMVPADRPLDEGLGRRLAEWAAGGTKATAPASQQSPMPAASGVVDAGVTYITPQQEADLHTYCIDNDVPTAKLKSAAGVAALSEIKAPDYDRAMAWAKRYVTAREDAKARA